MENTQLILSIINLIDFFSFTRSKKMRKEKNGKFTKMPVGIEMIIKSRKPRNNDCVF